jgi:hypothetical protein
MIQVQVCLFKSDKKEDWQVGIAKLNSGFGCSDVDWIINEDGKIVKRVWDCRLLEGPMNYLQTPEAMPPKIKGKRNAD